MKAQLSYDYYFALILFVIFIASLFFRLITFFPAYSDVITTQRLRAEAYQISEILVNDVGHPGNWHTDAPLFSNVKRLGLSDEIQNKTNLIANVKTIAFDFLCETNYNRVLQLLDISDGFLVTIVKIKDPPERFECLPAEVSARIRTEITRIVALNDGSFGNLTVSVWKR